MAKSIASADNGIEEKDGALFFTVRKRKGQKTKERGALECAIEYKEKQGHNFLVKHAEAEKDHWYASFPNVETASEALARHDSRYFEQIEKYQARRSYMDLEFIENTVLCQGLPRLKASDVIQKAADFICDFADEFHQGEQKVSREVQISRSKGQCESKAWRGKSRSSGHVVGGFGFEDQESQKAFMLAAINKARQEQVPYLLYEKDGEVDCIIDKKPYMSNQSWRCLNSIKPEDRDPRRRLVAAPGSSCDIQDHLVGIYTAEQRSQTFMVTHDLHVPKARVPKKAPVIEKAESSKSVQEDASILPPVDQNNTKIPADLIEKVVEAFSQRRAHDYQDWSYAGWGIYNVCWENDCMDLGHALFHKFSQKSAKYDKVEVDAFWNSTRFRDDGLKWPTVRSWLKEDNRKLWLSLRKSEQFKEHMVKDNRELYREQFMAHVNRYMDVIKTVQPYRNREVLPINFKDHDVHIEWSAMDTGKGSRILDQILSGQYRRVVVYVNRTVLCRSVMDRINSAIAAKLGHIDQSKMFKDYRRPEEEWVAPDQRGDGVASAAAEQLRTVAFVDGDSEDEDAQSKDKTKVINLKQYPFVVMQMESGWRIEGPAPDLMVVDECESDLAQFWHSITLAQRPM